ncbi:nucleotide exchange factor GrpE [Roseibium sp. CAU 1637]|uniref:Protein GrpE n=1 Tax=Roseibium limicola TaxID=2816037 RepID=A0A939J7T1_9HYPH|nr:nucleotide exchange factor GrpE [Roseibium limicola]MBO0346507.1 nucleotide exchange factor GrpE [Roseibium limicola]
MSDENKNPEGVDPEATQAPADEVVSGGAQADAGFEGLEINPLEALQAENAELKDRVLRVMAEMENLRRRTDKEIKDTRSYAVTGFARDMLSVSDNLRRALDSLSDESRTNADAGVQSLIEGVDMTERDLLNQLDKNGVKKLDPEGQKFDPHFHQAMFEVPNMEVPNNTVVQVVQAGYRIGERVLRPAMVGVSKGGPKEGAVDTAAAGDSGQTVDKSA